ncbi:uncharacterized protein ARMOST_16499 [Armillaria ostoyae]|uniref:Uncharacterized protein n=1 Tax=Armillaria ostoyae TaxID=47428 RepID=A0A284RWD6_ARMOS|nr:uncharacterized protein ARMOST_16499 [Armillaria ostoyae]
MSGGVTHTTYLLRSNAPSDLRFPRQGNHLLSLRPVLDKAWHTLTRRIPLPEKAWSPEERRYIPHPKRQAKVEEKKPELQPPPAPSDGMSALDRAKAMVDSKKRIMIIPPPRPRNV